MAKHYVLLFLLLAVPLVAGADAYKPYLHKPAVPDAPGVRLFGQYNTLLFPGAATYTYPIDVPPGTHGLRPSLVIAYNSQTSTQRPGILGAGWSMGGDYIYRDVNSTPGETSDDKFLLVFHNNVYELFYNPADGLWHTEVDYHFKIQQLTGAPNTDGAYWVLTTTDGTTYRFGYQSSAEVGSNTGQSYALKWLLDQQTDTYSNTISYNYAQNLNTADTGTAYLTSISYNRDQQRKITFTYENTPRQDLRTTYEQGNKVQESTRLTDIQVVVNGTLVRRYHMNYTMIGPASSSLAAIARFGADNNSLLHTVTFTYYPGTPGYTNTSSWIAPVAFDNASGTDTGVRLLDVNNDGFTDIIKGNQGTGEEIVWLNNHTGWVQTNWTFPTYIVNASSKNISNDLGVRFADANNDGLLDILVSKAGSSQVWLNNGTGWTLSTWTIPVDFVNISGADQGVQLSDLDGDGRVDLLRATSTAPTVVYLNNGTGWVNRTSTWTVPVLFNDPNDTGARLLDINGDGLPDIIQARNNGTITRKVWLNNDAGWTDYTSDYSIPVDFTNTTFQDTGVRFLDIDADGLVDLVQNMVNGTIVANNTWLNNGTGWNLNNTWQTPIAFISNGSNTARRLADITGDGSPDMLLSTNGTIQNASVRVSSTPYLLSSITNEYGGTVTINYTTSTAYNNTDTTGAGTLGFNIYVVQNVLKNNSIPGTLGVLGLNNYSYAGGKFNYTKREFRGFALTTEQQPTAVLKHYFYQDGPRRGKEYTTEVYNLTGALFSRNVKDYNYTYLYGIYNLSLRSSSDYQYDGNLAPRVTNTTYVYDWFGNPLTITEQGDITTTGDERTTTYVYAYNKAAWILDHPARITVTDALGQKARETVNYYDNQGLTGIGNTGSLTRTESWNNNGNNTATDYEYDNYGNVLRTTDAAGAITQYGYDATHTFATSVNNVLGHITTAVYDLGTGNLLSTTKNGITTTFLYDTHCRKVEEMQPYDTKELPTKRYTYYLNGTAPTEVVVALRTTANKTATSRYYYDGLANLVQVKTDTDNGQIIKSLYYDGNNHVVAEDNPYLASANNSLVQPNATAQTNYTYDALDRVILVLNPDGTTKTTIFDRANITDFDENGHRHVYQTDALGRITAVVEYNADPRLGTGEEQYTTTYAYDANDNLITITDTAGHPFLFRYDSLGRKTGMTDPDMGTWTYTYDTRDNLISQTDARGQTITLSYDLLNRVLSKNSTDANLTFAYDAQYQGTLSNVSMNNVSIAYAYDQRLRVVNTTQTINGKSFTTAYLYDSQDRVISEQGLSELDYYYDTQGTLASIPGYITNATHDAFGSPSTRVYANNITATYTYDPLTHRLAALSIPGVQRLNYTYDAVGNIKSINDLLLGNNQFLNYDGLDRLIEANISNNRYEYNYNALGNMMNIVENGQAKKFVYNGLAHAPSSIITENAGADVSHITELGGSKNRTISFFATDDLATPVSGVNVSVDFGNTKNFTANNLNISNSILFLVQQNYTTGGDYKINVSATAPGALDYEIKPSKFGVRAGALRILGANISVRTLEFDVISDINETLSNVSWNCTGTPPSLAANVTGSWLNYFGINYSAPGPQNMTCTATGLDGSESKTTSFTIDGVTVTGFDTLSTNVSRRVIGFAATNNYYPLPVNVSVTGENNAFANATPLANGETLLVFAEMNNTPGSDKGISVMLASPSATAAYTNVYDVTGVSIEAYQRVDLSNTSKVLLYTVRNRWNNGTVSWNLSDPSISNSSVLANNATLLVIVATNYTGAHTPTLVATSAGDTAAIADPLTCKPVAVGLLTLTDGPGSVSELSLQNNGGLANITWTLNTGLQNISNTSLVNASLLAYIQANYTTSGIYRTTATANASSANDTANGVVIV